MVLPSCHYATSSHTQDSLASSLSFSQFKYSQVANEWKKSCSKGNLETSARWLVEMILSHWTHLWWEQIILFAAQKIHIENPKLPEFLCSILSDFPVLEKNAIHADVVKENHKLKQSLFFVLGVCCFSSKGNQLPSLTIVLSDYEIKHGIRSIQNYKTVHSFVKPYAHLFRDSFIPLSLSLLVDYLLQNNLNQSIRILSWILFIEKKKNFKHFFVVDHVSENTSWTSVLWKVLIATSASLQNDSHSIVLSWFHLYSLVIQSDSPISKKNKFFSLFVASILSITQTHAKSIKCIQNYSYIEKVFLNIDSMFQHVIVERKKNIIASSQGI
jgi:hypothetical protein